MRFIGSTSSGTVNFPLRIHLSIGGRTGSSTVGTVRLGPAATSATPSEGSAVTTPDKNDRFGRRELLQRGALAGLGVGLAPLRASAQPAARAGTKVQRYVTRARSSRARSASWACRATPGG